jgi:exonuclease III
MRPRELIIAGAITVLGAAAAVTASSSRGAQPQAPASFKVAFFNIRSGHGQPALRGRARPFTSTRNCTDTTKPMNAWGTGLVQQHLLESVGKEPVIALGLAESWASVCGSPEHVRKVLGWAARTSERNGVAMVARYGFAGPEQWEQLDTTLNTNPKDTMWVLHVPVCLDRGCSANIGMFVTHWFGTGENKNTSYDRQAQATVAFLRKTAGGRPHVLVGDLNVWEGTKAVCGQQPNDTGLARLRAAGYADAWQVVHGDAEGYTGMTNRRNCGSPEGYVWKRPDYVWAPAALRPRSIERFATVPPGEAAPSDHYGLIAEFPLPGRSTRWTQPLIGGLGGD